MFTREHFISDAYNVISFKSAPDKNKEKRQTAQPSSLQQRLRGRAAPVAVGTRALLRLSL